MCGERERERENVMNCAKVMPPSFLGVVRGHAYSVLIKGSVLDHFSGIILTIVARGAAKNNIMIVKKLQTTPS